MAKTHQQSFAILDAFDEVRHVLHITNFHEHPQDCFVGTPMQRAIKSGGCAGHRCIRVSVAGANHTHGGRTTILFMISMKNKKHIKGSLQNRIGLIPNLCHFVQHVQKITSVAQFVIRINIGQTTAVSIREGCYRRHFGDKALNLLQSDLFVMNLTTLGIESGHCCHGCNKHAHGMGIIAEGMHEMFNALMHKSMMCYIMFPRLILLLSGQFTKKNEVGDLKKVWIFSQLFNGITTIAQDPLITINIGNGAFRGRRILKGRIIAHHAEVIVIHFDLTQFHGFNCVMFNGNFVSFAGSIISNRQCIFAHSNLQFNL